MNIPAIGTARGVFELFLPGAFVILNIFAVLYSVLDSTAQDQVRELAASPILSLVILICLGYLAGAILRLFGTEMPDSWSAELNQFWNEDARSGDTAKKFKSWAVEGFPYIEWIGETHSFRRDPDETDRVKKFYKEVWKGVIREGGSKSGAEKWQEKTFFNHCKTLINSVDERAATEIYSAEALVRYLTGMFYALLIAWVLMLGGIALQLVPGPANKGWVPFLVLLVLYSVMMLAIIRHYRIMRIKEVEIVFSATYQHRELFEPPKTRAPLPSRKRSSRARAILTRGSR